MAEKDDVEEVWVGRVLEEEHGDVEENGQEELVVDGHRDKPALIELRRSFPHHDTQSDAPEKDHQLH